MIYKFFTINKRERETQFKIDSFVPYAGSFSCETMLVSVNKDWRILRFDLGICQFNGERENDEAWDL